MRNFLAHRPTDVDLDLVWGVITDDFPELIDILEPIVGEAAK